MSNSITIRNRQYKVEPVSKIYFRGLTECLRDLGDVDLLSKSAKAIKKVIIPTIPDDVIVRGEGDEEFFLWHPSVEPEEINDIILNCARCYRVQKLEEAKAKDDQEAIAQHTEGLELIDKYLNPEGIITVVSTTLSINSNEKINQSELEELRAELKALKASTS